MSSHVIYPPDQARLFPLVLLHQGATGKLPAQQEQRGELRAATLHQRGRVGAADPQGSSEPPVWARTSRERNNSEAGHEGTEGNMGSGEAARVNSEGRRAGRRVKTFAPGLIDCSGR